MSTAGKPVAANELNGNMSEIQALEERIRTLGQSADSWNDMMVWSLVLAALAAFFVVVTTVMALRRSGQKDEAQSELIRAKDRQLALDLRDKDIEIGSLKLRSDSAEEEIAVAQREAAQANEKAEKEHLASVQIQSLVSARSISPDGLILFPSNLSKFRGATVTLRSYSNDPESYGLTRSILSGLNAVPIHVNDLSGV